MNQLNHQLLAGELGVSPRRALQELCWIKEFAQRTGKDFSILLETRLSGFPLAYIFGYWDFYGREFVVNPRVLIPRPETEGLVELVLKMKLPRGIPILDIGCGAGVIGITLRLENPDFGPIYLTDIDPHAIKIAGLNAKKHDAQVNLIHSDLLNSNYFTDSKILDLPEGLIVANLPYIPASTKLDSSVRHFEPHHALFSGEQGLDLINRLIASVPPGWKIVLEIDETHLDKLPGNWEYFPDLFGRTRYAIFDPVISVGIR
jgi:release factor glutamine methyltransferase